MNKSNILSKLISISTIIFLVNVVVIEAYFLSLAIPENLGCIIPLPHKNSVTIKSSPIPKEATPIVSKQPKPIRKIVIITKVIKKTVFVSKKKTKTISRAQLKHCKRFIVKKRIRVASSPVLSSVEQSSQEITPIEFNDPKVIIIEDPETKYGRQNELRITPPTPPPTPMNTPITKVVIRPTETPERMPKDPAYRKSAFYNRELRRN